MKLTEFEWHLKKIAESTLKMPDTMVKIIGGMTKDEAKEILGKLGKKELEEDVEKI
jgi:polyhydroxyalkanoate synthesis regulator phasin